MDSWRSAERTRERRLWGTLTAVGVVLSLMLLGSLLLTPGSVRGAGSEPSPWFYVQQAVLLVLSVAGTALAVRRGRALRSDG